MSSKSFTINVVFQSSKSIRNCTNFDPVGIYENIIIDDDTLLTEKSSQDSQTEDIPFSSIVFGELDDLKKSGCQQCIQKWHSDERGPHPGKKYSKIKSKFKRTRIISKRKKRKRISVVSDGFQELAVSLASYDSISDDEKDTGYTDEFSCNGAEKRLCDNLKDFIKSQTSGELPSGVKHDKSMKENKNETRESEKLSESGFHNLENIGDKNEDSSTSSTKKAMNANHPAKKICTFPVKRTKCKPLPILEETYPTNRKATMKTFSKHNTGAVLHADRLKGNDRSISSTGVEHHNDTTQFHQSEPSEFTLPVESIEDIPMDEEESLVTHSNCSSNSPTPQDALSSRLDESMIGRTSQSHSSYSHSVVYDSSPKKSTKTADKLQAQQETNLKPNESYVSSSLYPLSERTTTTTTFSRAQRQTEGRGQATDKPVHTFHQPEKRWNQNDERLFKLCNNGILSSSSSEMIPTSNFDPKHLVNLLELVNMSVDFLGCLKKSFSTLVYRIKQLRSDRNTLLSLLMDHSNVYLLEGCNELLNACTLRKLSKVQHENLQLSINALSEILKYLKQFKNSFNVKKLAQITHDLSTNEIADFLKVYIAFRSSSETEEKHKVEFTSLYHEVVSCQIEASFQRHLQPNSNIAMPSNHPLPSPALPVFCSREKFSEINGRKRTGTEWNTGEDNSISRIGTNRITMEDGRVNRTCTQFSSWEEDSMKRNQQQTREEDDNINRAQTERAISPSIYQQRNDNTKEVSTFKNHHDNTKHKNNVTSSSLPLQKNDLEKLVSNFAFLETEQQVAIRSYIEVLGASDTEYASSLLQRIDNGKQTNLNQ